MKYSKKMKLMIDKENQKSRIPENKICEYKQDNIKSDSLKFKTSIFKQPNRRLTDAQKFSLLIN